MLPRNALWEYVEMLIAPYPTKKALRESKGKYLRYQETSIFGPEFKPDGENVVAGPTEYHKWYAQVWCADGIIQKVK